MIISFSFCTGPGIQTYFSINSVVLDSDGIVFLVCHILTIEIIQAPYNNH